MARFPHGLMPAILVAVAFFMVAVLAVGPQEAGRDPIRTGSIVVEAGSAGSR